MAHELAPLFEFYRNQEFFERKDKRKKVETDEEAKKAASSTIEAEKKKLYEGKTFKLKIIHRENPAGRGGVGLYVCNGRISHQFSSNTA